MIDLNVLEKGQEYTDLKLSFVIFICTFDPFPGNDRRMYTFTNRCHEQDGLELGDETVRIFLNTKGTRGEVDDDIARFLAYVDGKTAEGEFTQTIAAEVERVKQHDETRVEYMTLQMAIKEHMREAVEEKQVEHIRIVMEKLNMTVKQAMDFLNVPPKEQKKYAALV